MKPQILGSKEGFLEEEWCLERKLDIRQHSWKVLMSKDTVPRRGPWSGLQDHEAAQLH